MVAGLPPRLPANWRKDSPGTSSNDRRVYRSVISWTRAAQIPLVSPVISTLLPLRCHLLSCIISFPLVVAFPPTIQECEVTGKKDATLWRLTSAGTLHILKGVGCTRGGSTLIGGSGAEQKTPDAPVTSSLVAGHMLGERTKLSIQTI